jgi:hypothetical protein
VTLYHLRGREIDAAQAARERARDGQLRRLLDASHECAVRLGHAGHALADMGAAVQERWFDDRAARPHHIVRARSAIADAIEALEDYARAVDDAAALLVDQ